MGTTAASTPIALSHLSSEQLAAEVERLRLRLHEAEDTLQAIRDHEVDAFVVSGKHDKEVLVLGTAHRPYRLLLEEMHQGAVTLSREGTVLYANQRVAAMLAAPIEGIVGAQFERFVHEGDKPFLTALLANPETGVAQSELRLTAAEGPPVSALVTVNQLLDEPGIVCLILTDLTERKRQDALVAAETLSRSILDQAVDAIVVCDTNGRILRASRTAHHLCSGNPLLQPFVAVFPLESEDGTPDLSVVLGGRSLHGLECVLRQPDGGTTALLVSAGPVTQDTGELLGCVVTMTDITKQKRAEAGLKEADRRKDEFLGMLAHELRNPLAPLRNGLEIIKVAKITEPTARRAHAMMNRQIDNLVRLVDDLVDVGRITSGKIHLRREVHDLRTVVERAIESSQPHIEARRHRLSVQLPSEPIPVEGDAVRLGQVFINLLNNAAKFTPDGGRIAVTVECAEGLPDGSTEVLVRVRDSGIGIAAEWLDKVFDPFMQADAGLERTRGGLGIGLTLARRLVEMHGGRIEARSEGLGEGSEIIVRLAMQPNATIPDTAHAPHEARSVSRRRVLIVDDNRDSAESLTLLLQSLGHEAQCLHDGREAVEYAPQYEPDVVLLDIGLPGMSGNDVVRQLRTLPPLSRTRFIALTGYSSPADRERSRLAGFDHYLVKPLDLATLEELLASA